MKNKIYKKILAVVLAGTMIMSTGIVACAEEANTVSAVEASTDATSVQEKFFGEWVSMTTFLDGKPATDWDVWAAHPDSITNQDYTPGYDMPTKLTINKDGTFVYEDDLDSITRNYVINGNKLVEVDTGSGIIMVATYDAQNDYLYTSVAYGKSHLDCVFMRKREAKNLKKDILGSWLVSMESVNKEVCVKDIASIVSQSNSEALAQAQDIAGSVYTFKNNGKVTVQKSGKAATELSYRIDNGMIFIKNGVVDMPINPVVSADGSIACLEALPLMGEKGNSIAFAMERMVDKQEELNADNIVGVWKDAYMFNGVTTMSKKALIDFYDYFAPNSNVFAYIEGMTFNLDGTGVFYFHGTDKVEPFKYIIRKESDNGEMVTKLFVNAGKDKFTGVFRYIPATDELMAVSVGDNYNYVVALKKYK